VKGNLQLVMQDLEHGTRRKKRSVLSKLAGSSHQTSPRSLADSLDSVGDDQTSRSDDYGLEGSQRSCKVNHCTVDSKNYSPSDVDEPALDDLNNDDNTDKWNIGQNYKNILAEDLNDDCDDDDDDDYDDVNESVRRRPGSSEGLSKHDKLNHVDDFSSKQSPRRQQHLQALNGIHDYDDVNESTHRRPGSSEGLSKHDMRSHLDDLSSEQSPKRQQHLRALNGVHDYDDVNESTRRRPGSSERLSKHDMRSHLDDLSSEQSPKRQQQLQALNGVHNISNPEDDEDISESEELGAMSAAAKNGQKFPPSTPVEPLWNTQHSAALDTASVKNEHPQVASSSLFMSTATKVAGLFNRTHTPTSSRNSNSTSLGGTVAKMSTKDARNRFVFFVHIHHILVNYRF